MAGVLAVLAVSARAQPKEAEATCRAGDARACEAAAVRAAERGNEVLARQLLRRADLLDKKQELEAACEAGDADACEDAASVSNETRAGELRERAVALKKARQVSPAPQPAAPSPAAPAPRPGVQNPAAACEAGSAPACEALAVDAAIKGDTETARALLSRAGALRAAAPPALPPPRAPGQLAAPPLISADETLEEEAQQPRQHTPLPSPEPTPQEEEAVATPKTTPSYPVGIIAVGGAEIAVPVDGTSLGLRPRVGVGMRFALSRRSESGEKYVPTPAAGFVVGYAGLDPSPRFFGEGRVELVVNRPGDLFQPGFTVYAITGFDAHVRNGGAFDPYVGAGLGWDLNIFVKSKDQEEAKPKRARWGGGWGSGWGGGWGAGAGVLALLLVPAIIGFVCIGRVEVRYHPVGVRGPASVDVLLGLGF